MTLLGRKKGHRVAGGQATLWFPKPRLNLTQRLASVEKRLDDLVTRMTLEERVSQMMNAAPAIGRVGLPPYDWENATCFASGSARPLAQHSC
jgi:hypothetical protein